MNLYTCDFYKSRAQLLSGKFLYIAGSDLYNPLNQPSQHLPFHLAPHLNQLDLVGYVRFYDGPRTNAWTRILKGTKNILTDRIRVVEEENIRKLIVRRIRLPGFFDPLLQDSWLYSIMCKYLKHPYDVAIVDGPESAVLSFFLKKSGRIKHLIYYDIDFYPGVHPQWAWILSKREKLLCKISDATVSVSRPLAGLREQQGSKLAVVIPNGVDFNRFHLNQQDRKEHPITLIYVGSLDERWGVDLPIQAMPILRLYFPDIQLIIAGRGPAEHQLRELVTSLNLESCVYFKGFIPYNELPDLLTQADIGVATSRMVSFRWYASPLKIVEYMSAGLPVICSGGGEAESMITESGAGINIPFNPEAFAKAVISLFLSTDNYSTARERAINYARGRSWEQMGTRLADLVSELMSGGIPKQKHKFPPDARGEI